MKTFNVFFAEESLDEMVSYLKLLGPAFTKFEARRNGKYQICKVYALLPNGEKILVNMVYGDDVNCIFDDMKIIHTVIINPIMFQQYYTKLSCHRFYILDPRDKGIFKLMFNDLLSNFQHLSNYLLEDPDMDTYNVLFHTENIDKVRLLFNTVFEPYPKRGQYANGVLKSELYFEADEKNIKINLICGDFAEQLFEEIHAVLHFKDTNFYPFKDKVKIINCNNLTFSSCQLIDKLTEKDNKKIEIIDKKQYPFTKTVLKMQPQVPKEFNILLIADDYTDLLFLRHIQRGKFQEMRNNISDEIESIYPLKFSEISINVIQRGYHNAYGIIDEVDGVIVIPFTSRADEFTDITHHCLKRLIGSFTPIFTFTDFDKIWDLPNKKERFLEPFTYIIKELTTD